MPSSTDVIPNSPEPAHFGEAELSADGCFLEMDAPYLAMLGKQDTSLLGQHWRVSVDAEDHQQVEAAYRLARLTGRGYAEIRASRRDSKVVYQAMTLTGVFDSAGTCIGFHCLRHDISRLKRDRDALVLAVESTPNGLLMLNSEGLIQSANRAVETLFGYSRPELIGQKVEMLLPERFRGQHPEHRGTLNIKDGNAMAGTDLVGLNKAGVEIPLQLHLNRIETHNGELILYTFIDIAERVQHEQQLELAKQAAETANRAKTDFLSRMSHEIRTPMNLIMGMNALLLESPLNEKQKQQVEISDRNVRRLLRLINGILDLSKVEAGMLTLVAAPFDLSEVIQECAATMSSEIERKGLELKISIDPDVWLYWIGDAERLQQVLLNVVGNSVKFTERGTIEVQVRCENFGQGERGLRFEVTDTGCGIPSDKAGLIFEAFQQADGAMNRPYEGTGLGLSIGKTLVEMMAGKIWLEKSDDKGSKFVFTTFFPFARKEEVRAKTGAGVSAHSGKQLEPGMRLLLVEDNPENVILLRAYLDNPELFLHFASNGLEAVTKRQHSDYDLALMDVQMPVMDGYTATREIRTWERVNRKPHLPIVALTAHALSGAFAESLAAGCDGHLSKPVERDDLVATIVKFAKHPPPKAAPVSDAIAARQPAFLENRRLDLKKLRDALAARDFAAIQHIGHNCKGIGTGYGFPDISKAGSTVECAARARDFVEVEKSIQQFERSVQQAA